MHLSFATSSPSLVCLVCHLLWCVCRPSVVCTEGQLIQFSCVTLAQTGGKRAERNLLGDSPGVVWKLRLLALNNLFSKYGCASHLPRWSGPDTGCQLTCQHDTSLSGHHRLISKWLWAEPGCYHQTCSALLVWLLWDGTLGEDAALLSASLPSHSSLLLLLPLISSQVKQLVVLGLVFY